MNTSIATTLRTLTADTERLLADRLRPIGITVPQMQFLTDLAANPDHCGADLAKASHVSAQTGTTILQNLVAKRLITVRHVPGKGRRNRVTVTARGTETLSRAQAAVADVEKQLAALLGTETSRRMATTLTALQPHRPTRTPKPKKKTAGALPQRISDIASKSERLHQRCREWAQTVGDTDSVPDYVALQLGTQAQIDWLVAGGTWKPDGGSYRISN
jgi:DNA-binding MarR family transcriptional regulator